MRRGFFGQIVNGIWKENPIFVLVVGLCPTLACTTKLQYGVGMALAATFVLICSNLLISLLRKVTPAEVRIPIFIAVIATFTTVVDNFLAGYFKELHSALSIFIPLIVVNCIIMARAEMFASKNPPHLSVADGIGIGLGFLLALTVISSIREVTGACKLWDIQLFNLKANEHIFKPVLFMSLPPGAFLLIAVLLGAFQWGRIRKAKKKTLCLACEKTAFVEALFEEKMAKAKEKQAKKTAGEEEE